MVSPRFFSLPEGAIDLAGRRRFNTKTSRYESW